MRVLDRPIDRLIDRRVMTLKIEVRATVRCVYTRCTQSLVWDLYHIQGLVRVLSYTCARHGATVRVPGARSSGWLYLDARAIECVSVREDGRGSNVGARG